MDLCPNGRLTYVHSDSLFLQCRVVHLDGSKSTYTYRPNGRHFFVNLDKRPFRQSKITLVGSNFGPSKCTVVERNFGPSKITVVDRNFGPSKITVFDRNFGDFFFFFFLLVQMVDIYP